MTTTTKPTAVTQTILGTAAYVGMLSGTIILLDTLTGYSQDSIEDDETLAKATQMLKGLAEKTYNTVDKLALKE